MKITSMVSVTGSCVILCLETHFLLSHIQYLYSDMQQSLAKACTKSKSICLTAASPLGSWKGFDGILIQSSLLKIVLIRFPPQPIILGNFFPRRLWPLLENNLGG